MLRLAALMAPLAAGLALALPAAAHEFWLEPAAYRVAPGGTIEARAINGEDFAGVEFGYNAESWARSGLVAGDAAAPLTGARGQKPAVQAAPLAEGLHVIHHTSPLYTLTYDTLAEFADFLRGKGLEAALEAHAARGLPEAEIRESYFRYAKALVAVGDGTGSDHAVGMAHELVALDNPYTGEGPVTFRLLFQGTPSPDAPVYVFRRTDAGVERIRLRTDAEGRVEVPRAPGEYMVNAIRITRPPAPVAERTGAHWVTLWASSTYRIAQ